MRHRAVLFLTVFALARGVPGASSDHSDIVSRIKRQPVGSSALASVGYSQRLHALEIEFRNGSVYRYDNVPPDIYHHLMTAPSKARFYDQNVRGHFPSRHVKPRPQ